MITPSMFPVYIPELDDTEIKKKRDSVVHIVTDKLVFPLDMLTKEPFPEGVDKSKREEYLSDADFQKVFKQTKEEFAKFPKWKQTELKKKAKLF